MDTFVSEIKLTEHDHEIEHDYRDRTCVDLFTAMERERDNSKIAMDPFIE